MVNPGPDEPSRASEYPTLENSPPPADPYAPVDYPSDTAAPGHSGPPDHDQTGHLPPDYAQPEYPQPGYAQPNYGQPGYAQPDYPQPGHAQPGYPQPGYVPPGYPQPGFAQPGYPQLDYPQSSYPQSSYPQPSYPPPSYPPPYPAGPYGYDPYGPPRPTGTNGKAIAALVTSLVGLMLCGVPSFVGVILGVIGMRETKRTGQEGYGLALAGVIVGVLAVAGWLLYLGIILFAISVSSPYDY